MNNKEEVKIPRDQLENLYEKQKLSIRKLAKTYACGATTIYRKLHKWNIQVRPSLSIGLDIPKNRIKSLYEKQRKSSTQIAKIYSCSSTTILNRLKEYGVKIKDISEAHIKYPKKDFSGNLIEKAYLIGFRIGDLHIRRYEKNGKVISAECASTRPDQISLIHNLFKRYGHVRITPPNKRRIIGIQCGLNSSFKFLLNKEDKIKSWILSNDKLFFAFLAGYIDAEGDIGIYSKNTASLRIGTYDKNILSQIQNKLSNNRIDSTFNLDRLKGSRVNLPKWDKHKNREYKTNQDFWRLAVYKKKSLKRLFDLIAPFLKHQKTRRALLEARENIYFRNQKFGNLRMS